MAVYTIPKKIYDLLVSGITATVIQPTSTNLKAEVYTSTGQGLTTLNYFYDGGGFRPVRCDGSGFILAKITDGTEEAAVNPANELNVNTTDNLITETNDYAGAETDTTFLTPTAGKKLQIHNVFVSTNDKTVNVTLEFPDSTITVFKMYTDKNQLATSAIVHIEGAVDEVLEITCGAGTFVSVTYHEV